MPSDEAWSIEPLRKNHIRDRFDSGIPELDEFIQKYARQNERRGLGRTFVATRENDTRVFGYFTLRTGEVKVERLPPAEAKRFPRYPVPVVHLARLAVDRATQGQGLGELLLATALRKAYIASTEIASFAVEVIAINEQAKRFYLKFGFHELLHDSRNLYLPMKTVRRVFEE